jgi:hypothetical protein
MTRIPKEELRIGIPVAFKKDVKLCGRDFESFGLEYIAYLSENKERVLIDGRIRRTDCIDLYKIDDEVCTKLNDVDRLKRATDKLHKVKDIDPRAIYSKNPAEVVDIIECMGRLLELCGYTPDLY